MTKFKAIFFFVFLISAVLLSSNFAEAAAPAQISSLEEQKQLAMMSAYLDSLKSLLSLLEGLFSKTPKVFAQTSCPANVAFLLPGCHDMGNAYFNSAMDQYVNYNGTTVYYCSTNYISGCSSGSGGTTTTTSNVPALPSDLAASLLSNGTDVNLTWSDNSTNETRFDIYRRLSGGAWSFLASSVANNTATASYLVSGHPSGTYEYRVQACNTNGCSSDSNVVTVTKNGGTATSTFQAPPYVTGWTFSVDSATGKSTLSAAFNTEMDQSTLNDTNFYVYKATDPDDPLYHISGVMQGALYNTTVLTFNSPLLPGVEYVSVIKASVKSKGGLNMTADYICRFTALAAGSYDSCPSRGGGTAPPPKPIETLNAYFVGTVLDAFDKPVSGAWVHLWSDDYNKNFDGSTDSSGAFKINVSADTYYIEVFAPHDREDLLRPEPLKFSVGSGETKDVRLKFRSSAVSVKVINGYVLTSSGRPVVDARVGAYSERTGEWRSVETTSDGSYVIRVGPGRWTVNVVPVDERSVKWRPKTEPQIAEFRDDGSSETRTLNFYVSLAEAEIKVRVRDGENKPLKDVGVVIDSVSSLGKIFVSYASTQFFGTTDVNGEAIFHVPPGKYFIKAYLPPELGFLNPDEQTVDVSATLVREVNLVFAKRTAQTSVNINGLTKLENGEAIDAFVWGWSETGGFVNTRANEKGEFVLQVSKGSRWHIGAGAEKEGFPYKSGEVVVDIGETSLSLNLVLFKISKEPLPLPTAVTRVVSEQIIAQVDDGAKVVVPGNAVSASGEIKVEVTPTVEAPSQASARVVGTVYDVEIEDQSGKPVVELDKEIEITLPYNENDLKTQGATEDTIQPSYFDEKTNTWVKVDNYTIDKEKNIVIIRVKHLTRFAIVAPADVTPPAAPTALIGRSSAGEVILSWVNPKGDFHHVKVYRSEKDRELGILLSDFIVAETYKDKSVNPGATYYYNLRAVDAAGNESTSTKVKVVVSGAPSEAVPLAPTQFTRTLARGMSGSDVKKLQQILQGLGFFPSDVNPTEFFGPLTERAVKSFQTAKGLEALGIVGPKTREELNKLSGVAVPLPEVKSSIPPGQAVKVEILRNLSEGSSGEDVKALQEFLVKEGVYPEGLITGFFGRLTKQAVIRFQEKYASEILIPNGLTAGNGFVGPSTRKKISELSSK